MMRRKMMAVGLVLVAAALASQAQAQRRPDVRLNTESAYEDRFIWPQIAVSGSKVFVAWNDLRNGPSGRFAGDSDLYFNRSVDGGSTWMAEDLRIIASSPNPTARSWPQISASDDRVTVVWRDVRSAGKGIYANLSTDDGTTWQASDIRVDRRPGSSDFGTLETASSGDAVYALWKDWRHVPHPIFIGDPNDLYFNRSLDGGLTWMPTDIRLNTNPQATHEVSFPKIAAIGNTVFAVWEQRQPNQKADIAFNRSLDGGSTWLTSSIRLDRDQPGSAYSQQPEIIAVGNSVYVAWVDNRNGPNQIYFNRSLDGGSTWDPGDRRLDTGGQGVGTSFRPEFAVSGDAVYVTWINGRFGSSMNAVRLNRSLDRGATWLSEAKILSDSFPDPFDAALPLVEASGKAVYVVWEDMRNGRTDIYFNRSLDRGSTWLDSAIRLDGDAAGSAFSTNPNISVADDSVYLTWTDERDGFKDIYFTIPFGALPYGEGTPGSNGNTPSLHGTDALTLGSTFTLSIENAIGGAAGLLAVGGPGSKADIPLAGGSLLIDPIGLLVPILLGGSAGIPGEGAVNIKVPIPPFSELIGFNLNFQAALLDPAATAGMTLTNAVEAWIL